MSIFDLHWVGLRGATQKEGRSYCELRSGQRSSESHLRISEDAPWYGAMQSPGPITLPCPHLYEDVINGFHAHMHACARGQFRTCMVVNERKLEKHHAPIPLD